MKHRAAVLSLVFAGLGSVPAPAQFTTFVAPPRPNPDSVAAAALVVERAVTDSIARAQLTDMKAWVDSAAGVVTATADTIPTFQAPSTVAPRTTRPTTHVRSTTIFTDGAAAPDTAGALPLLALIGLAALSLGIVLLHRRPRA